MAFSNPSPFPAFPPDLEPLTAETLSLVKLIGGDAQETKRLFSACCSTGLFLLDLSDHDEGSGLMRDADAVLDLSETIFDMDLETKNRYLMLGGTVLGYKAAGTGRIDTKGTPDRCEFWCMAKDDILGLVPPLAAPEIVTSNRDTFTPFIKRSHNLSMLILERLEEALGIPAGVLRQRHRIEQQSQDQTRQIKYSPQIEGDRRTSLVPHTDYGSITVLFNILGGLQVLLEGEAPEEKNWRWLKPQRHCAIINLGDAMVKFTNGLFKSPMHRVTYAPGDQATLTRYSLAYFTRPENKCIMRRVKGSAAIPELGEGEAEEDITAEEWVKTRVKAARVQEKNNQELPQWATKGLK